MHFQVAGDPRSATDAADQLNLVLRQHNLRKFSGTAAQIVQAIDDASISPFDCAILAFGALPFAQLENAAAARSARAKKGAGRRMKKMTRGSLSALSDQEPLFRDLAPGGCYVALRVGFLSPEEECNLFPSAWIRFYTVNSFGLRDPLTRWAATANGAVRWSAIHVPDEAGILASYRRHGLRFGCVVGFPARTARSRKRTFGIFARGDREMTNAEIATLRASLAELHAPNREALTPSQAEVLRMLSEGVRYKEIAHRLGITEGAVKARFKAACDRLGARTAVQAANIAQRRGLI
ncbi:LuxR C-terminal-related transcriptional regulator [Rhodobacter sp. NSM]|uniref:LuxR C-terminal-related transcriptional regulator n=1 Tax=Rhodobacter sp. NSM TaxID=3457501 RepID=UPI003FCF1FA7